MKNNLKYVLRGILFGSLIWLGATFFKSYPPSILSKIIGIILIILGVLVAGITQYNIFEGDSD